MEDRSQEGIASESKGSAGQDGSPQAGLPLQGLCQWPMTGIRSEQDQHQPDLVLSLYYVSGTSLVTMEMAVNKIDEVPALRGIV